MQWFNLLTNTNPQINWNSPFFQANQNAPKNPTIFAPFEFLWDTKNIQQWIPIFFISYFQDGNSSQEWWYTIFKVISSTWSVVNRMFIWQAKASGTYQIPAKNKTYTYWFYQTQNISNLFLSGWNLNTSPTGITWLNITSWLPIGTYQVYIQNINKFWLKSDEALAWTLNVLSSSVWGTVVKVWKITDYRNFTDYQVDPTKFWFSDWSNINISVNKWWATKVEYINNSVADTNLGAIDWANWTFSNINLLEWNNYIVINFKDDSDKIINTVPLVINVDTKAPVLFDLSINETDYINKETKDSQINMLKYNSLTHINDHLSKDWAEDITNEVPIYMEYLDNNLKNINIYYWSTEATVTTQVTNYTGSWYINWKRWAKFTIPGAANTDILERKYFSVQDWFGNKSNPLALNYEINRAVNTPIVITNWGKDFSLRSNKVDLRLSIDKDVNRIDFNGNIYPTSWNTELTLYWVLLTEWENVFTVKAFDILNNMSNPITFKIIRTPALPEWLVWTDTQLQINGNVNAKDINFNRITNDWSAWELIQWSN
jgi:hypothetical protein